MKKGKQCGGMKKTKPMMAKKAMATKTKTYAKPAKKGK